MHQLKRSELKLVGGGVVNPTQMCGSVGMVVSSVAFNTPASTVTVQAGATIGVTLGIEGKGSATDPTNVGVTVTCVPPPPPVNCANSSSGAPKTSEADDTTPNEAIAGGPDQVGGGGGGGGSGGGGGPREETPGGIDGGDSEIC